MRERVAQIIAEREYLIAALKEILCVEQVLTLKPTTFWRALKPPAQCLNLCGIRALSYVIRINNPLLSGCLRITVGTREESQRVIDAFTCGASLMSQKYLFIDRDGTLIKRTAE